MKIALVYDAVYPWVKGGAQKRNYELGRRLAKHGHEVHVFGIKWWDGADTIKYEGMVLHGVCSPMELYVNGRRSITEAVIFSIKLFPHLVKEKFDVIDVSAFPYLPCFTVKLVSVLKGNCMLITWHEVWKDYWYEYLGRAGFFGKLVEYLTSKLASGSIAVSTMTKNNLESLGGRNIQVLPNGIDLEKIARAEPSPLAHDIIFAGRLIKEKNVDVLLEAVGLIKDTFQDIKCLIIGDGPEKDRLIRLATELKVQDNIKFSGFLEYDEVISYIKSSRVFVLPSGREGFGMVVIESFACGVPVITVKCEQNAASSLVSEDTGFVVNLDVKDISNAILKLITDTELRKRMSISALDTAKKYEWDIIAMQLAKVYEERNRVK
ncbi:MAG: glycosyltransferase family 4 protein [Candidatus Methanoperedens sp.]|nr:glycosyltransferase family 4 protein [Candidatus Methanoperedens sp.]